MVKNNYISKVNEPKHKKKSSSPLRDVTAIIMYELTMTNGHLKSSPVPKDYYCLHPRAVLEPFSV